MRSSLTSEERNPLKAIAGSDIVSLPPRVKTRRICAVDSVLTFCHLDSVDASILLLSLFTVSSSSLSLKSRPSPMFCDSVRCREGCHRFDWGLNQRLTDEFTHVQGSRRTCTMAVPFQVFGQVWCKLCQLGCRFDF